MTGNIDYKSLSEELDSILSELQDGSLDIDKSLKKYQRGMVIVQQMQKYLKEAENKVKKVKKDFAN